MLLVHARAQAHTFIYRSSASSAVYHKTADVPDADAEDWEPIRVSLTNDPPAPIVDCGCGQATTLGDVDDD